MSPTLNKLTDSEDGLDFDVNPEKENFRENSPETGRNEDSIIGIFNDEPRLNAEQLTFYGIKTLFPDLLDLDTSEQFFFYLFANELIAKIAMETNLYQVQKGPNKSFRVAEEDVRQFRGVVFLMSFIQLSRVTNHWSPILGTSLIQETINLNKFEKKS